ncbi:MAG: hypothetical protein EA385_09385 [Salinarimonadaceae bacterium]|nr:MAG: hypothetical protein EA385_09385 [Salinarimonadaceae bacterium]
MRDVLRVFGPFSVWFACFSAVYGLHGLVCSERWSAAGLSLWDGRLALLAACIAAVSIQVGVALMLRAPRLAASSGFTQSVSLWLGWAAVVATLWSLFPVVVTSTCT